MSTPWEPTWNKAAGCWTTEFRIEGRRIRRRLPIRDRSLKTQARQRAREIYREEIERGLSAPQPVAPYFWQAAQGYVSAGGESRFLPKLMQYFGQDTTIEDIGEVEIAAAAMEIYPKASPDTHRRQVRVPIRAVLRWARGERRQRSTDTRRTRWLLPAEAESLLNVCDDLTRQKVGFLLGTGCRTGEMFRLEMPDLNLATRQAFIADPKNGRPRWVRFPARTLTLLGKLPEVGAVFRTPKGLPYKLREKGGGQMQGAFNKARDAAGLGRDVTPHTLRHTWATWYYAQTRDFGGLMDLGGWEKADMANRYRKLAPDDLGETLYRHGWDFGQESGQLKIADSLAVVSK